MEVNPKEFGPGIHWVTAVEGEGGAVQLERLLKDYGPLWQVRSCHVQRHGQGIIVPCGRCNLD